MEAKNREERGGERREKKGAIQRQGWERSMKGNKPREGLKGGNRLARWRINLKINKRVTEFSGRGWRGSHERGDFNHQGAERRTSTCGWRWKLGKEAKEEAGWGEVEPGSLRTHRTPGAWGSLLPLGFELHTSFCVWSVTAQQGRGVWGSWLLLSFTPYPTALGGS